jgi:hypothetical protein
LIEAEQVDCTVIGQFQNILCPKEPKIEQKIERYGFDAQLNYPISSEVTVGFMP